MFISITGHEKLDKIKNKGRIGIMKKYLNKVKIVEPCDSIISEILICDPICENVT